MLGTKTSKVLAVCGDYGIKIKAQAKKTDEKMYLNDEELVLRRCSLIVKKDSFLNNDFEESNEESFFGEYADENESDFEEFSIELEDYDVEIIDQIILALEVEYGLEKKTVLDLLDYLYELDEIYDFNSEEEILIILEEEELELISYFNNDELREIISALVVLDSLDVFSYL